MLIANIDVIVGFVVFSPSARAIIVASVVVILSPIAKWKMISNGEEKSGKSIAVDQPKPGDKLLCFNKNGKCTHVALYIGDGKYVDCTSNRKRAIDIGLYSGFAKRNSVSRAFRPL